MNIFLLFQIKTKLISFRAELQTNISVNKVRGNSFWGNLVSATS